MVDSMQTLRVPAGEDRFGEHRGLGISTIEFKLTPQDGVDVLVLENVFHARGGPARHLHYEQDEWFSIIRGEFTFEVGSERMILTAGDSLLAPRRIAHVWAFTGEGHGRILVEFFPAGKMEAFFREVTKTNAMPVRSQELWRAHGMELLGPPLLASS